MKRTFTKALAFVGWWGPQMSAAERDRAAALELENKALREKTAELTDTVEALRRNNACLIDGVKELQEANQNLWAQGVMLGEAHATRNIGVREAILAELASMWELTQTRAQSGRMH